MAELEQHSAKLFDGKILKQIFRFVKPYQNTFYFIILLTLAMGLLAPLRPYLVQYAIDNYILESDLNGLNKIIIALVAVLVMEGIVFFAHAYLAGLLGQKIVRDIRIEVYEHILKLKLRFYDQTPIGRLVTRSISDIETLSNIFTNGLANIAGDILKLLFILVIMLSINWQLTLVSLSTIPVLVFFTYIFKEKVKGAFNEARTAVSNLNSFVQEHITGMSVVQIFNSQDRELKKFESINVEFRRANIKTVLYYSIYFPVSEILAATGIGLLVWFGTRGVIHQEITLGTLIGFLMYMNMFYRPIRMIADRFNTLQLGIVSSDRILTLLKTDEIIPNTGTLAPQKIKGDVRFENVSFAYDDKNEVLKDISFEVKAGEMVALVGATGAGKSSIINLLSKFYPINKGKIFIDNQNLDTYDLTVLRSHIGVVLQDVFLFSGSVFENITLGNPNISLQKVKKAAELVGAKEFIERLPNGFDYEVMERGATLSVGQRQLISFVRVMVYKPEILILDEATSSVDSETESLIQHASDKMMEGRTSIVVAHRLSTIRKADKIIVLEQGKIKEIGTHEVLLEKGEYYASLYQMQYKHLID